MRTDSAGFSAANKTLQKEPRYAIEMAFDTANSVLRYFTSHSDAALPAGATAVFGVVQSLSGTSQTLNPDTATASIGNFNFSLVDRAGAVTLSLGGQLALGRSTRLQRVRLYVGYVGLAWSDYALVLTQIVQDASYKDGIYSIRCLDVQRQLRSEIFDIATTTLTTSLLAGDLVVNVVATGEFQLLEHGPTFSDAPGATVGYLRVQDEIIRYTGTTPTSFTGCTRGALNTLAIDHLIDPSVTADRQTEVKEYVYLEFPAIKLFYALLTGIILGTQNSLVHSEEMSDASWIARDSTITTNMTAAPDGSATADLLTQTTGSTSYKGVHQSVSAAAGHTYTITFYVKVNANVRYVSVDFHDFNVVYASVDFDLQASSGDPHYITFGNGNAVPVTGSAIFQPVGNGWIRVGATFSCLVTTTLNAIVTMLDSSRDNSSTTYTGSTSNSLFVWGAQMQDNSAALALPYAKTVSAARAGSVLPTSWHLGVSPSYVRLTDFLNIGDDLWRTVDDDGFVTFFQDLAKTDGKKFIETELNLLTGTFAPIYSTGELGCKRMSNILTGAGSSVVLDETNVVSYEELLHDFPSMHNVLEIDWNWEPLQSDFTRKNFLIDGSSVSIYGAADTTKLAFRGLYGSRHSQVILSRMFDSLRDRYSAPPYRLQLNALAVQNALEVGEIVRVKLKNIRDYVASGSLLTSLDRSFEIQNISMDWITGALQFKLMATSRAPDAVALTSDSTVLTQPWYVGTGTSLSSILTITGSNPGHVSASGVLSGGASVNDPAAIFYYDGDLQIDAGVQVTLAANVQLRVKGFLQINGVLNGIGGGWPGASVATPPGIFDLNAVNTPSSLALAAAAAVKHNDGVVGFLGSTEAGGGITSNFASVRGAVVNGLNAAMPLFNLSWDLSALVLSGLPSDLRGTSGSSGMPVKYNPVDSRQAWAMGGAGGNGGAGLCIVCRGLALGAAGKIDLSGANGQSAALTTFLSLSYFAGSGAGGAPGGLLVLLDGAGVSATGLTESGFVAKNGKTFIQAPPLTFSGNFGVQNGGAPPASFFTSFFVGTGDDTVGNGGINSLPLPNLSGARGGSRVQYIPADLQAAPDPNDPIVVLNQLRDAFLLNNWVPQLQTTDTVGLGAALYSNGAPFPYLCGGQSARNSTGSILVSHDAATWESQTNPTAQPVLGLAWNGSAYVAVGSAPNSGSGLLLRSTDGITWTQQTPPASEVRLNAVVWVPWLNSGAGFFVAVGDATFTGGVQTPVSKIWTSPDGITWTARSGTAKGTSVWYSPTHVVVGGASGGVAQIDYSADGITWNSAAIDSPSGYGINGLAYGNGFWVGVGGENVVVVSKDDGATWTKGAALPSFKVGSGSVRSVAFSGQVFAIAGIGETGTKRGLIVVGRDGQDWQVRTGVGSASLKSIVWANGFWLVVGGVPTGGTNSYIATTVRS